MNWIYPNLSSLVTKQGFLAHHNEIIGLIECCKTGGVVHPSYGAVLEKTMSRSLIGCALSALSHLTQTLRSFYLNQITLCFAEHIKGRKWDGVLGLYKQNLSYNPQINSALNIELIRRDLTLGKLSFAAQKSISTTLLAETLISQGTEEILDQLQNALEQTKERPKQKTLPFSKEQLEQERELIQLNAVTKKELLNSEVQFLKIKAEAAEETKPKKLTNKIIPINRDTPFTIAYYKKSCEKSAGAIMERLVWDTAVIFGVESQFAPTKLYSLPQAEITKVVNESMQAGSSLPSVAKKPMQVACSPPSVVKEPMQVACSPPSVVKEPMQVACSPPSMTKEPTQVGNPPPSVTKEPTQVACSPPTATKEPGQADICPASSDNSKDACQERQTYTFQKAISGYTLADHVDRNIPMKRSSQIKAMITTLVFGFYDAHASNMIVDNHTGEIRFFDNTRSFCHSNGMLLFGKRSMPITSIRTGLFELEGAYTEFSPNDWKLIEENFNHYSKRMDDFKAYLCLKTVRRRLAKLPKNWFNLSDVASALDERMERMAHLIKRKGPSNIRDFILTVHKEARFAFLMSFCQSHHKNMDGTLLRTYYKLPYSHIPDQLILDLQQLILPNVSGSGWILEPLLTDQKRIDPNLVWKWSKDQTISFEQVIMNIGRQIIAGQRFFRPDMTIYQEEIKRAKIDMKDVEAAELGPR